MATEGASDLHLAAGQRPHWRIDGEMHEIADVPVLGPETVLELLGGALPDRNREEFARTNDTDFALELPGVARFRVNLFRDLGGVGAVLRMIPSTILSLEKLGMPKVVAELCALPKGLVLVTGPTGSGKSTTLAAMVDLINRTRRQHVVSLEDPVEFVHASQKSLVNQREVGRTPRASRAPSARRCARTPTSSWWGRCATWRPCRSRSRPRTPATWCSPPSTPRPRSPPSNGSSDCSRPRSRAGSRSRSPT